MKTKKITNKDIEITACLIDGNKIFHKVHRVYSLIRDLSDSDILSMDDKMQANRLMKLKKLLSQSMELSVKIDSTYYDGLHLRGSENWN